MYAPLVLLLAVIVVGMFTESVPEIVGGILAGLAGLALVWFAVRVRLARPLKMWFSMDPFDMGASPTKERHLESAIVTYIGRQTLLLRVMPNEITSFSRIGLRFARRYWLLGYNRDLHTLFFLFRRKEGRWRFLWDWQNPDKNSIEITKLRDMELVGSDQTSERTLRDKPDKVGGRWAEYNPPYIRSVEDSLWICVEYEAKKTWDGHISFVGTEIKGHRPYVRRSIKFVSRQTPIAYTSNCYFGGAC